MEHDGSVAWRSGGADLFTGERTVTGEVVDVTDFNGDRYRWALADGALLHSGVLARRSAAGSA